jgi:hypothetical protein
MEIFNQGSKAEMVQKSAKGNRNNLAKGHDMDET